MSAVSTSLWVMYSLSIGGDMKMNSEGAAVSDDIRAVSIVT